MSKIKYIFPIVDLFILIEGIVSYITTIQYIDKAIVTTGTVVSMESHSGK